MKARYYFVVSAYVDGETDFATLLARRPLTANAPELGWLVDAAYEAQYENPDGTKKCSILFVGHSDRNDTAGVSPSDRVRSEHERSKERAESARTWLLDRLNDRAQAAGQVLNLEWLEVDSVVAFAVGVGASQLAKEPVAMNDRLFNRRIYIVLEGLNVAAITAHDHHVNELTD
ncbi:hypothetical protein SAMN05216603_12912 [Pseudomonas benzenivorans]|nr:hypothetical protein [Pseudomonas benzenivorans]SDI25545.1 hypothetical protein SAMN05216603_12912 [Pseudomonas benzenivorans]